jgi:hypothetical protein
MACRLSTVLKLFRATSVSSLGVPPSRNLERGLPKMFIAKAILVHALDSASKYYSEILKPEHDDFFTAPATLRSAFRLAGVLFHFRDWLFHHHKAQLQAHFGTTIPSPEALWEKVQSVDRQFGFIRDVANGSKHVGLTRPSTSMTHIANTVVEIGDLDSTGFDIARVKIRDGSVNVEFDHCARALFRYWTELSPKIGVIV